MCRDKSEKSGEHDGVPAILALGGQISVSFVLGDWRFSIVFLVVSIIYTRCLRLLCLFVCEMLLEVEPITKNIHIAIHFLGLTFINFIHKINRIVRLWHFLFTFRRRPAPFNRVSRAYLAQFGLR